MENNGEYCNTINAVTSDYFLNYICTTFNKYFTYTLTIINSKYIIIKTNHMRFRNTGTPRLEIARNARNFSILQILYTGLVVC